MDNLVADIAPDAEWISGANVQQGKDSYGRRVGQVTPPVSIQQTFPLMGRPDRTNRILEIVERSIDNGGLIVKTNVVVETLQIEGYEGSTRNLSVAVGNVLARSLSWRRVGPGEYEWTGVVAE